jgi:hypothetical protein
LIVDSFKPGCAPINWVMLSGHADRDVQRGRAFETRLSGERAQAVRDALIQAIARSERPGARIASRVSFVMRRHGATQPIVRNAQSEAARARNRRVVLFLVPGTPTPPPPPPRPDLNQVVQRARRLIRERPNHSGSGGPLGGPGSERIKRLECVLSAALRPDIDDHYVNGFDASLRDMGNLPRMTTPQLERFMMRVRNDLRNSVFAPSSSDTDVLDALVWLDRRILSGIQAVDRYIEVNGAASDAFRRQLKNVISGAQRNPKSVYFCYGAGQR